MSMYKRLLLRLKGHPMKTYTQHIQIDFVAQLVEHNVSNAHVMGRPAEQIHRYLNLGFIPSHSQSHSPHVMFALLLNIWII